MARTLSARQPKRWLLAVGLILGVALVFLSPSFGRAHPSGDYRPLLPPDALTNGCYPLPAGVTLDFPYQVRTDGDSGTGATARRTLVLQYDLIDREDAARKLVNDFLVAGFTRTGDDPAAVTLTKPGVGDVHASVATLDRVRDGQIVRGTITLDLPVVARASDTPVCSDAASTKRFSTPTPGSTP